jgi:uncharacterized protein YxjI
MTQNPAAAIVDTTHPDSQKELAVQTPYGSTFVLNQTLTSITGDLTIDDERGNRVFEVDGKAFSLRRRHQLLDASGDEVYEIAQALANINRTFEISHDGRVVATVQQALLTILGDQFTVTLADGSELEVQGDLISREFRVTLGGNEVIFASRHLVSIRDSYGVRVAPGFDVPLALAIVVALEQMELEKRQGSSLHH